MKRIFTFFIISNLFVISALAQSNFSISGIVKDNDTKQVMEYATVSLYNTSDSSLVTGLVTNLEGKFTLDNLKPGNYYVDVSFIGFKSKKIGNLVLSPSNPKIVLPVTYLGADADVIGEVEVTAIKQSVKYELDKKVVDVDKNIAASSGTAADVLATVPSVQTDIDGNVSLRGSSNFKVFINGRPSVLDANDALQQIPASTIENIEIITNPSAKYDAEGTGGIINIITKKQKLEGFSGIINVRGGIWDTYGGDATLSYKKKRFTFLLSGNYNHMGHPGTYESVMNTTLNDTTVSTINNGTEKRSFTRYNINAGIEYDITDNSFIGVSYRYGAFKMLSNDELDYQFINRTTGEEESFTNYNESLRKGPFHEFALNYGNTFKNKHELKAGVNYNFRNFLEQIDNKREDNDELIFNTKSEEKGPSSRLRINIDYTAPVGENSKFEFGFLQELSKGQDENIAYILDVNTNEFTEQNQFYSDLKNSKDIRAFYGTFSSKWKKLSYQIGVRSEHTNRVIESKNLNTSYKVKRLDLFPSTYFSYQFNDKHQMFLNYSKRINRPRPWYLEPNVIYSDANTLWGGNPDLLPEYIHSVELGWLYTFSKKGTWSNEVYFRNEQNVISFIRLPVDYQLTLQRPENVGVSNSVGLESSLSYLLLKWWNTDLMANLFYFNLKGSYQNISYDRSSFSYNFRWNNYFTIKKNTKFQFNASYSSPIVTAQGKDKYILSFDAGFRQSLLNKQLEIGLQGRNIFGTVKRQSINSGPNFDYSRVNKPKAPSIILSLSYKINNYKAKKPTFTDDGSGEF